MLPPWTCLAVIHGAVGVSVDALKNSGSIAVATPCEFNLLAGLCFAPITPVVICGVVILPSMSQLVQYQIILIIMAFASSLAPCFVLLAADHSDALLCFTWLSLSHLAWLLGVVILPSMSQHHHHSSATSPSSLFC
jgi:hypothetical protein